MRIEKGYPLLPNAELRPFVGMSFVDGLRWHFEL